MSQHNPPEAAERDAYLRMRRWAAPLGGSAWAKFFTGPKNIPICDFTPQAHPDAICLPDGAVSLADTPADTRAEIALALPAGPGISLAAFIGTSLPGVMAARIKWDVRELVGPNPTPAQAVALERCVFNARHRVLHRPTRFSLLLTLPEPPENAAPVGQEFIALTARLHEPVESYVPFTLAILPPEANQKFTLGNRTSLLAWLRARRIELLTPESSPFEDTARLMARATRVLLLDPRQAALLGLCNPRTKVLEVAPEGWASGRARALCDALGLEWRIFLATPPFYPLLRPLPFGTITLLSYEVPIKSLGHSLRSL